MRLRRLPIITSPVRINDIASGVRSLCGRAPLQEFSVETGTFLHSGALYLTCSGIAAFYVILEILKESSAKNEVVIPAYTAGSLVVALQKAGLRPVLADVSLDDFNLDTSSVFNVISDKTLAVVGVHMFGNPMHSTHAIKNALSHDVFFIEDCAQSFGSTVKGVALGTSGDLSFYSFNRGKNLPLYSGGCISVHSQKLRPLAESVYAQLVGHTGACASLISLFKVGAFTLATNPLVYGVGYPLIGRFKQRLPPEDFCVTGLTPFQAALGIRLLKRIREEAHIRYANSMYLKEGLADLENLILPRILEESRPAFNRFPFLCKDLQRLSGIKGKLWRAGIECSALYDRPLHHMYELGYAHDAYAHAVYVAKHLLTLPVHPAVKKRHLDIMIDEIRGVCR